MTVLASKTCPGCNILKPSSDYWLTSRRGGELWCYCKACAFKRARAAKLAVRYGLSQEQYAQLIERQGGGCAICGDAPGSRGLSVDHDHETGEVRGLLCGRCNMGLGYFLDSTSRLSSAIHYLGTARTGIVVPQNPVAVRLRAGGSGKGK